MFSEKLKNKIVEDCFEDVCDSAQKEDSGFFGAARSVIRKYNVLYIEEKNIVVVKKNHELTIKHTYKLAKSGKRLLILQKLDDSFVYSIKLNDEVVPFECDQYSCECLSE